MNPSSCYRNVLGKNRTDDHKRAKSKSQLLSHTFGYIRKYVEIICIRALKILKLTPNDFCFDVVIWDDLLMQVSLPEWLRGWT